MRVLGAIVVVGLLSTQAQAHHRHHHHFRVASVRSSLRHDLTGRTRAAVHQRPHAAAHFSSGSRPRAWCGWYMRQIMGVTDASYNLARNWAHYGSNAGGPGVGVVVVWPHHVGRIVGVGSSGRWLVESGNDGHRVRTRERDVSKAIAFRRV